MVILDTSIIYKWVKEEDNRHPALKLLQAFLEGKEEVMVPNILLYELANVLSAKTALTISEAREAWDLFTALNLKIYPATPQFLRRCLEFAKKYHVTVYDAAYAVLAKEKKCRLITDDIKFIKQVNLAFIKPLSDY